MQRHEWYERSYLVAWKGGGSTTFWRKWRRAAAFYMDLRRAYLRLDGLDEIQSYPHCTFNPSPTPEELCSQYNTTEIPGVAESTQSPKQETARKSILLHTGTQIPTKKQEPRAATTNGSHHRFQKQTPAQPPAPRLPRRRGHPIVSSAPHHAIVPAVASSREHSPFPPRLSSVNRRPGNR